MNVKSISYLSDLRDVKPKNDNLDVHVTLKDCREFTFVVATPQNIYSCMEREQIDYFFGSPIVFVKSLTADNIEKAAKAIVAEDGGRWLTVYG